MRLPLARNHILRLFLAAVCVTLILVLTKRKKACVKELPIQRTRPLPVPASQNLARKTPGAKTSQGGDATPQLPGNVSNVPAPQTTLANVSGDPTYMVWPKADGPGVYRACVPRPKDSILSEVVTGGRIESSPRMTVVHCIHHCIALGFTYAALSRGRECFCSDVKGNSALLDYKDSALCDVPCPGEPKYHCGGEVYMSLYRTTIPDSRCSTMELKPKGSLPLIALASYPRSGNTWTRQLIQRGTGIPTGSVFWKNERRSKTASLFPGGNVDYRSRRTICVKTHYTQSDHVESFAGAVLLIRNPYRALVAEVFRRVLWEGKTNGTTENALQFFKSPKWKGYVHTEIETWRQTATQWITKSRRIHVTHYEDMEANTYDELAKIVRFLNVTVDPERVLCATQEHPSSKLLGFSLGASNMEQRVYLKKDPFSTQLRESIDAQIQVVNQTLISYKLTPLPNDYSVESF